MVMTLRCDHAARLISDQCDRKLKFHERLALSGHLLACRVCFASLRKIKIITDAGRRQLDFIPLKTDRDTVSYDSLSRSSSTDRCELDTLSESARSRMKEAMKASE